MLCFSSVCAMGLSHADVCLIDRFSTDLFILSRLIHNFVKLCMKIVIASSYSELWTFVCALSRNIY